MPPYVGNVASVRLIDDNNQSISASGGAILGAVGTQNVDGSFSLANGGGANVMASGLVSGAGVMALQILTLTGSTVLVELSNDNTNWFQSRGYIPNTGGVATSMTAVGIFQYNMEGFKYWRIRQSVYGSGTTTGIVSFGGQSLAPDTNITSLPALPVGANKIGLIEQVPGSSSSGGTTTTRILSAGATDNATIVKASAGKLYRITGQNKRASSIFIKLYNKATAPTSGDTPVITEEVLASSRFVLDWSNLGRYFSTGIGMRVTAAAADADATLLTAGDFTCMNIEFV